LTGVLGATLETGIFWGVLERSDIQIDFKSKSLKINTKSYFSSVLDFISTALYLLTCPNEISVEILSLFSGLGSNKLLFVTGKFLGYVAIG
jgi:hypothetical protein